MPLFDSPVILGLKGENFVTGLAIGTAALIVWPLARPLTKVAAKGVILAYREATRLYGRTTQGVSDLTKEALEELGGGLAKEGVEEAGGELVKEGVGAVAEEAL